MKILFIQNRMLLPANTGGKIRSYNILKHLAQWHKITYLCNLLPGEERYESELEGLGLRIRTVPWSPSPHGGFGFYRDIAINLFSRIPFNIARHFSPALRSRAHEVVAEESSDLIICDFLQSAKHVIDITSCPVPVPAQRGGSDSRTTRPGLERFSCVVHEAAVASHEAFRVQVWSEIRRSDRGQ